MRERWEGLRKSGDSPAVNGAKLVVIPGKIRNPARKRRRETETEVGDTLTTFTIFNLTFGAM